MANELDEMNGPVNSEGRDINVIEKQLAPTIGIGTIVFELAMNTVGFLPALFLNFTKYGRDIETEIMVLIWLSGVVPGLIYMFKKVKAKNYFQQLQQKIQADSSQIDNFLEQRVVILQNVSAIVSKSIDLDKDVMKSVAAFRTGGSAHLTDQNRSNVSSQIDGAFNKLFPTVEAYPDLKAHSSIQEAMRQNSYLQREVTSARALYNDTVAMWNADLFSWPVKQIVAVRSGYSTRIPFTASSSVKTQARGVFF